MKILVSQPRPGTEKSPYFDVANKYGVDIVFRPFIRVDAMPAKDFRQQKVSILDHTAVVFTSRHGIDHFFALCKEMRVAIPESMKYFCTSEIIALYLQKYIQYRKRKVFFPMSGKMDDLIPIMVKHKAEKYFVPQSSVHDDELKNKRNNAKLNHTEAVMYYTVANDFEPGEQLDYDMVVLFSPEGIHSLLKNFPDFNGEHIALACIGVKTMEEAENLNLRVDYKLTPELRSVPAIIEEFVKNNESK